MKILNIFLSILILLLALACAVFSYLLFSKRAQMLDGWDKFAVAISTNSANIDKDCGTEVGKDLTPESLSHKNHAQLAALIEKYNNQLAALLNQRKIQTRELAKIASMVGAKNISEDALRQEKTWSAATEQTGRAVGDHNSNHTKNMRFVLTQLEDFGISANAEALLAGRQDAKADLERQMKEHQEEYKDFRSALNEISVMNFSTSYKSDTASAAVTRARQENKYVKDLEEQLAKEKGDKEKYKRIEREVREIRKKLAVQNKKMAALYKVLGMDENLPLPTAWAAGSAEARAKISGKIIEVNSRFGYVGVNLGTDTRVEQKLSAKKMGKIDPKIEKGMKLKVFRGYLDNGKPDYIAVITLDKVGSACSIANISAGMSIQVGDSVLFENDPPDAEENLKVKFNAFLSALDKNSMEKLNKVLNDMGPLDNKKVQDICAMFEAAAAAKNPKKPAAK